MGAPIISTAFVGSPDVPPDEVLVAAAVGGDRDAFDALANRHWRMVLRTALQIVGPDRAEDAAQDALLLAYRALPDLQDGASFPGWISTITRYRALRLSRSENRRRAATLNVAPAVLEAYSAPEADSRDDEDAAGELRRALNAIPNDFARVVRLHFFEGLPHREIASLLGVPVSTVKWRCFRGMELLRRVLRPGGPAEARIGETCRRCRRQALGEPCGCPGEADAGRRQRHRAPLDTGANESRFRLPALESCHASRSARKEGSPVNNRQRIAARLAGALFIVLQVAASPSLLARDPGTGGPPSPGAAKPRFSRSVVEYEVPDLRLVDQLGRTVSLRELLDERKPVALNFFFASCGSICPVMTATVSKMRRQLGRDGDDLRVVSITIDPDQDTPEVLRAYADRFSAGPGWSFVTGDAANILAAQRAFFADSGGKFNHQLLYFFRAPGSKSWVRLEGLANAADLAAEVRGLAAPARASR